MTSRILKCTKRLSQQPENKKAVQCGKSHPVALQRLVPAAGGRMQSNVASLVLEHSKKLSVQPKAQMRFNVASLALERSKIFFRQMRAQMQFTVASLVLGRLADAFPQQKAQKLFVANVVLEHAKKLLLQPWGQRLLSAASVILCTKRGSSCSRRNKCYAVLQIQYDSP